MTIHFSIPPTPPDPYRLSQLAVMNGGTINRRALQALPLCDLMSLAHLMAAQKPTKFTPDLAWKWLRFMIEPMEWEVETQAWATGDHYVAFFGGQAIASQPRTASGYTALCRTMQEWFAETYPTQLVSARWTAHHIAEAPHGN